MQRYKQLLICIAASLFSVHCSAACLAPNAAKLAELDGYVAVRYSSAQAQRIGSAQANEQCYWKVDYTLFPSRRVISLFLSPDGMYATPVLFDLSVDLAKEREEKQEAARKLLSDNSIASPKTGVKTPTLVVFSDYECPFCQRLAAIMSDPAAAEKLKSVDVQFRNYPLAMHPWAKQAALVGACVHRQNSSRLVEYQRAMFAAQHSIHPDTADAEIRKIAMALSNLNQDRLARCIENREAEADVEADLRLGSQVGVEGTPTVFIDGVKQPPFRSPEQLVQAITQVSAQEKDTN